MAGFRRTRAGIRSLSIENAVDRAIERGAHDMCPSKIGFAKAFHDGGLDSRCLAKTGHEASRSESYASGMLCSPERRSLNNADRISRAFRDSRSPLSRYAFNCESRGVSHLAVAASGRNKGYFAYEACVEIRHRGANGVLGEPLIGRWARYGLEHELRIRFRDANTNRARAA